MPATDPSFDPLDPGSRAHEVMVQLRRRDYAARLASAFALMAVAVALPVATASLLGEGATVGATVGGLVLVGMAVAVLPYAWSDEETTHRELESIWRQVWTDADADTPWERYAVWAEARGSVVKLSLIRRAPGPSGAPSPYERSTVGTLDPDDMMGAAGAMEALRQQATALEGSARERHAHGVLEADRLAHEELLSSIDEAAAADIRAREGELRREMEQREKLEREAQAEAVARALRRP